MDATCSAPDCPMPTKTRGLCGKHYLRQWRTGSLDPITSDCLECGVAILNPNGGRKRCDGCAAEFNRDRQSEWHKANPKPRKEKVAGTCILCGEPTPLSARGRSKCARCAHESALNQCGEDDCRRPARARRMCAMHYKRAAREDGRIVDSQPWDERRRANYERRRAAKMGATIGEPFTNLEIFERDRWICHLCAAPVDAERAWPDPMSSSLDHIVPLSLGGGHSRENTALAHLRCNVRKGNRAAGEQLRLIG